MNEDFISFIWRYQQFDAADLITTANERITIIRTGLLNRNAGPDFSEARIVINDLEWIGNVEIHLRSSDWIIHGHQGNLSYRNVILHVVWEDDIPVKFEDGTHIPTLCLKGRIDDAVHQRYRNFLAEYHQIFPCAGQFGEIEEVVKLSMLDSSSLERLNRKADDVFSVWQGNARDWEETCYQLCAQYFGFQLNAPCFMQLVKRLPLRLLKKHGDSLFQVEAMLFGAANLLPDDPDEEYVRLLQKEYIFLKHKFRLKEGHPKHYEWKFMRTRPAGFPTVRLAQFAAFIYHNKSIFSALINTRSLSGLRQLFMVKQSDYWLKHYHFGKRTTSVPSIGRSSVDSLIINVAVPVVFAYSRLHGLQEEIERVIGWLESLPAEDNRITRAWSALGVKGRHAFDSQGLIEWQTQYCVVRRCLECAVGCALICDRKERK